MIKDLLAEIKTEASVTLEFMDQGARSSIILQGFKNSIVSSVNPVEEEVIEDEIRNDL